MKPDPINDNSNQNTPPHDFPYYGRSSRFIEMPFYGYDEEYWGEEEEQPPEDEEEEPQEQPHPQLKQPQPEAIPERGNKKFTNIQRQKIAEDLLGATNSGTLKWGMIMKTTAKFKCSTKTLSNIWSIAKDQMKKGEAINVKSRMPGNVGRKKLQIDLTGMQNVDKSKRDTIRSLARALKKKQSTIHRLIQQGKIKSHTNSIKPYLTSQNKKKRLEFCLGKITPDSLLSTNPKFEAFYNSIHIDEKWFYMTKATQRYYLHPAEEAPLRTCKSKCFIAKVMFLSAVARPILGPNNEVIFDGKLGMWPFTYIDPAKRRNKNREAGTLEAKPILSITRMFIEIFWSTKSFHPLKKNAQKMQAKQFTYNKIINARPHTCPQDPEFVEAGTSDRFDIQLVNQPPNSPDLNILDLGFFRAIQSLQYETTPSCVVELVEGVLEAYQALEASTLNHVWLSLAYCITEILKVKGGNQYKLPHKGKKRLERLGLLPISVDLDSTIVQQAMQHLIDGTVNLNQFMIEDEAVDESVDEDHL